METLSAVDALARLGGVATRPALLAATSRRAVDAALATGQVIVLARGRYAMPEIGAAEAAAHRLSAALCLESAALHLGWGVKAVPDQPQIAVPKGRKLTSDQRAGVEIHRLALHHDDLDGLSTSRDRTLLDCLRLLPFDRALTVLDSSLRDGMPQDHARALARDARGPNVARMRGLVELGTAQAANPFESVLRAIALSVPGLSVRPQVRLRRMLGNGRSTFLGCPDLVDDRLRIVIEADSFEWHGKRAALAADARRYDWLAVDGWLVLRFAWEQVMFEDAFVRAVLEAAVHERTQMLCPACRGAS